MAQDQQLAFTIKILGEDGELSKLAKIEKSLKLVRDQRKQLNDAYKEGAVSEKQLAQSTAELNVTTKLLNKEKRDITRTIELETQQANEQAGTYKSLDATLQLLKRDYKALTVEEQKSAKGQELLGKIQKTDKTLKEFDASIGQNQRNVGNYSGALEGLGNVFNVFGGQISSKLNSLTELKAAIFQIANSLKVQEEATLATAAAERVATKATTGTSRAMKVLRTALISTGIGAIVVALGSLAAALFTTQKGSDELSKALRPLEAVFSRIFGLIQERGLKSLAFLTKAITQPKEALKDLGQAIVDNVINRFKGIQVLAGSIGKLLKGNFLGAAKDIANGAVQIASGIEKPIDKLIESTSGLGDEMKLALEKGVEIDKIQKQIEKTEIERIRKGGQLAELAKEQNKIAEDTTKSLEERTAAARKALTAEAVRQTLDIRYYDLLIQKKKIEHTLNDTSRADEKELAELERQKSDAVAARLEAQTTYNNKLNIINQQQDAVTAAEFKRLQENNKKILELSRELRDSEVEALQDGRDKEVEVLDNKRADREAALREQITSEEELTKLIGEEADQKRQINELLYAQIEQLNRDHKASLIEIDKKYAEEDEKLRKEQNDQRIKELDQLLTLEELRIREQVIKGVLTQKQGEAEILEIKKDYLNQKLALIDQETLEGKVQAQSLKNEIETLFQPQEKSALAQLLEITDSEAEKIKQTALNLAREVSGSIFQIGQTRRDNQYQAEERNAERTKESQIDDLDEQLKRQSISQEQYNTKRAEIEKGFDNFRQGLEREAFERNKKAAKTQAAINGALAITNIWATTPKVDFGASTIALIAASIASTALQIAAIDAQEFAEGGLVLSGKKVPANAQNIATKANGDNVLATVRTGEVVLNRSQQLALGGDRTFSAIGVPGFASGGVVSPSFFTPLLPPPIQGIPSGGRVDARLSEDQMSRLLSGMNSMIDNKIKYLRVSAAEMQDTQDDISTTQTQSEY